MTDIVPQPGSVPPEGGRDHMEEIKEKHRVDELAQRYIQAAKGVVVPRERIRQTVDPFMKNTTGGVKGHIV